MSRGFSAEWERTIAGELPTSELVTYGALVASTFAENCELIVTELEAIGYVFETQPPIVRSPHNTEIVAIESVVGSSIPTMLKCLFAQMETLSLNGRAKPGSVAAEFFPTNKSDPAVGNFDPAEILGSAWALQMVGELQQEMEEELEEGEDRWPFFVNVITDAVHKAGYSGGPGFDVDLSSSAFDPLLCYDEEPIYLQDEKQPYSLGCYMRDVVTTAGFPGLAMNHLPIPAQLQEISRKLKALP